MPARPGFEIREMAFADMERYVAIPSVFESRSILDVMPKDGRHELRERGLVQPFRKNYDLAENPMEWLEHVEASNWTLIGAFEGNTWIGGGIGASKTAGVDMLEGRGDLVVLWDLRVQPATRRCGVGSALFRAIEHWGLGRNCRELKVETQNTNVAACRFYARQGCTLKSANRHAYPDFPDEVQLLWTKALDAA